MCACLRASPRKLKQMGGNSSKQDLGTRSSAEVDESNWDDLLTEIDSNLRRARELSAEICRTDESLATTSQSVQSFLNRRLFTQEVINCCLKSDWPSVVLQLTNQTDARMLQLFARESFDLSCHKETFASQHVKSGLESMTALMVAVIQGAPALVLSLLLSYGADLEARDAFGRSPLILSARFGRFESLLFLLHQGAQTEALSFSGNSIDNYAEELWSFGKPLTNDVPCPSIQVINTFRRNLLQCCYLARAAGWGIDYSISSQCLCASVNHTALMLRLRSCYHKTKLIVDAMGLLLTDDIRLRQDMQLLQHKQRVQLLTLRAILPLLVSRMFPCDVEQRVMQTKYVIIHRCHSELGAKKIASCFIALDPPEAKICVFRTLNDSDIHIMVTGPMKLSPPLTKRQLHLPIEYTQPKPRVATIQSNRQHTSACFAGNPTQDCRVRCRDWIAFGCCRFGVLCKFEHAVLRQDPAVAALESVELRKEPPDKSAPVNSRSCWHWNSGGMCFWGDNCHFVHSKRA